MTEQEALIVLEWLDKRLKRFTRHPGEYAPPDVCESTKAAQEFIAGLMREAKSELSEAQCVAVYGKAYCQLHMQWASQCVGQSCYVENPNVHPVHQQRQSVDAALSRGVKLTDKVFKP